MITIDDKLYITKEINNVVVSFSKKNVLRKLLMQFSFTNNDEKKHVSDLIVAVNFYLGDLPDYEQQHDMLLLIIDFLNTCTIEEITSLYFWLLNEKYMEYYNGFKDGADDPIETFNYKFGRELAYKLYNPESTELKDELHEELQKLLITFASEFDFSLVNESSILEIEEMLERYCD